MLKWYIAESATPEANSDGSMSELIDHVTFRIRNIIIMPAIIYQLFFVPDFHVPLIFLASSAFILTSHLQAQSLSNG